jgi:hypothetical protein
MTAAEYGLPRDGEIGYFISAVNGEVMDVERWAADHDGAPVQVWHRKSTDVLNQQWLVRELTQGAFAISPRSGLGKALEQLKWPTRYEIPDTAVQWERHGRPSQLWSILGMGDGTFEIVNQGSGGSVSCAGHNKPLLVKARVPGDPSRLWRFEPVTA